MLNPVTKAAGLASAIEACLIGISYFVSSAKHSSLYWDAPDGMLVFLAVLPYGVMVLLGQYSLHSQSATIACYVGIFLLALVGIPVSICLLMEPGDFHGLGEIYAIMPYGLQWIFVIIIWLCCLYYVNRDRRKAYRVGRYD